MRYILSALFILSAVLCRAQSKDPDDEPDRQQFANIGDFKLESGTKIKDCHIGYRTYGKLNKKKDNGVLFLTWFGGTSQNIEEYAPPWHVIDTNRFYLIIADALGNGVSSSPSNSELQHGADFPAFSIRDMVDSEHEMLVKKMGIKHLQAVMGISMGGTQTFQWGISYPNFSERLIPVVGSPQPTSYDLMGYNIFRRVIEADTGFRRGKYKVNPVIPAASMMLEFFLTTPDYKTRAISRDSFAVWQHKVDTSAEPDWNDTYYQMNAIIGHDIARDYDGSLKKAADHINARMLIIVSRQDHFVNPVPAMAFAKFVSAKLVVLNNDLGHQAPNFEDEQLERSIRAMMADGP
ncbi:alpha/beta fold hydrolase [Mucilaginibacter sp.]|jgi:homoserine O-acetyltransferase|uniref:alpha/beta fold hydrolase n=1 Tax=Mucilaginibacter sp. TaxID=1882438 RepID=UPI002CACA1A7|nr:alpha/beta fold hydrolase [Mucilaginibacter sp.]HTI58465.1 alpha/beta fold hydrolase [Mucilaginibacter sp.]